MDFIGAFKPSEIPVQSVQIDRDRLGPPGINGHLHIVAERGDEPRSPEQRLADRTPRIFHVRALLAKVHSQHGAVRGVIAPDEGGCFITMPKDVRIQTPCGTYEVVRNSRQELALATRSLTATRFEEAFEVFLAGLTPSLDHFSFLSNTPIVVDIMEARDEMNHSTVINYRTPYGNVVLSEGLAELSPLLFPVYALYREAVNANSNFYRFLCFYKILEGIFRQIRPRLFEVARGQRISIVTRQELVPDDIELRQLQPDSIGRKIHDLYDREFQAQYRDSVAHFALIDRGVANPSAHGENARFANIMYLAQVCARVLIRNQEDYFRQFFSAGGRV